jgi:hypothetical protein
MRLVQEEQEEGKRGVWRGGWNIYRLANSRQAPEVAAKLARGAGGKDVVNCDG